MARGSIHRIIYKPGNESSSKRIVVTDVIMHFINEGLFCMNTQLISDNCKIEGDTPGNNEE